MIKKNFRKILSYSFSQKIEGLLNKLKLETNKIDNKKREFSQIGNFEKMFNECLEKIDDEQMDATELLLSPFADQRSASI